MQVGRALEQGFGKKFIELCKKTKCRLVSYNYQKRGDDRECMYDIRHVLMELNKKNPNGVWKQTVLKKGLAWLFREYQMQKGMSGDYLDEVIRKQDAN